jgi:hypothetical protein
MVSRLCVSNEYDETLNSGYSFPLAAHFGYVYFVFLSHIDWATFKALAMARQPVAKLV